MKQNFVFQPLFLLTLIVFISVGGYTQTVYFGNSWVNTGQDHLKLKVAETGIYRLYKSDLTAAGVPVDQISGAQFYILKNGKQEPVFVSSEGIFSEDDYVEFVGEVNDGEIDAGLYEDGEEGRLNPYYSLFTDSTTYFLTWTKEDALLQFRSKDNPETGEYESRQAFRYTSHVNSNNTFVRFLHRGYEVSQFNKHCGTASSLVSSLNYNFSGVAGVTGGEAAEIKVRIVSGVRNVTVPEKIVKISFNGKEYINEYIQPSQMYEYSFEVPGDEIQPGNNIVRIEGLGGAADRFHGVFGRMMYNRSYNFNNGQVRTWNETGLRKDTELPLTGFTGEDRVIVYDRANYFRTVVEKTGNLFLYRPEAEGDGSFIAIGENKILKPTVYNTTDMPWDIDENTDYIVISHPKIINSDSRVLQDYVSYRSSVEGGGFNVKVVNVFDVYNQFGYGIDHHNIALRNFANFLNVNYPKVRFMNIIGKGVQFTSVRTPANVEAYKEYNLIATYGSPGTDNLIATNGFSAPIFMSIGRIPVTNTEQLATYLDKLKKHESRLRNLTSDPELRIPLKRIVHLSGGDANIQASIRNYMDNFAKSISESELSALVDSYYKNSSEIIGQDVDLAYSLVNEGAFLVTFFGHSSATTFDLNIYELHKYKETDFYPISLALGCYSGNYHLPSLSGAENLSYVPNKGFLGMIANSGAASPGELSYFTRQFYDEIGNDLSNGYLREKLNKALNSIAGNNPKIFEQMAMLGDPAMLHFTPAGPDLTFEYSETSVQPQIITTDTDSIDVVLKVINLGSDLKSGNSAALTVERITPDGKRQNIYEGDLEITGSSVEFPVRIPVQTESNNVGRNKILAAINGDNKIEEWPSGIAYTNNQLKNNIGEEGYPFNVFGFDIEPIYPENFSIVPSGSVSLSAQVSSSGLLEDVIVFELDTTPRFDSGLKVRGKVPFTSGSIPQWAPGTALENGVVYYWRVSQDSTSTEKPFNWKTSSFTYIEGETGWNQSHWGQFIQDTLTGLVLSEIEDKLDFSYKPIYWQLRVGPRVSGGEAPYLYHDSSNPFSSVQPWLYRNSGIFVISFQSRRLGLHVNRDLGGGAGLHGSSLRGHGDLSVYAYELNSEASRDSFLYLIENNLPQDNFIFIGTIRNSSTDSISTELLNSRGITGKSIVEALQERGSVMIDSLGKTGKENFGIIYQNDTGKLIDEGLSKDDYVYFFLTTRDYVQNAKLKTPAIGPVKEWSKLHWEHVVPNEEQRVNMSVDVIDNSEVRNLVYETDVNVFEYNLHENEIDPGQMLSIVYNPIDSTSRILTPVRKLKVNYEPLPDLILSADAGFLKIDSIESGRYLTLSFIPVVYSADSFEDSVTVRIRLSNSQGVIRDIVQKILVRSDVAGTVVTEINTDALSGLYTIEATINPDRLIDESRYSNNSIYKSVFVSSDNINPLLDLTFDGSKILNGELVAANPHIQIVARDDNKYKLLNEIDLFRLQLKQPGENNFTDLNLTTEDFHFTPAQNTDKNEAVIEWNPVFIQSGDYELSINVKDVDGNPAGSQDRIVQFKVITENSISNLVNYPNPFSDRTRFVYTLTGYNVPYNYKIEIYTVSGKLIREITKEELGLLRVGTHMTDYEWDARDRYGNRLANGVYLYRLVILDENFEKVKHFESRLDEYSKANFSKMVIIK